MKSDMKYRKWGGFGAFRMSLKVTGNSVIQYSAYKFLLAFHSNYNLCLAPFLRYSEILVEYRRF